MPKDVIRVLKSYLARQYQNIKMGVRRGSTLEYTEETERSDKLYEGVMIF